MTKTDKLNRKIALLTAQLLSAKGEHMQAKEAFAALGISYIPYIGN